MSYKMNELLKYHQNEVKRTEDLYKRTHLKQFRNRMELHKEFVEFLLEVVPVYSTNKESEVFKDAVSTDEGEEHY